MPFRGHRSRRKTNKLPRARENAGDQLRIGFLFLLVREGGATFMDQSQSKVKQHQCNPGLLWTLN